MYTGPYLRIIALPVVHKRFVTGCVVSMLDLRRLPKIPGVNQRTRQTEITRESHWPLVEVTSVNREKFAHRQATNPIVLTGISYYISLL